MCPLRCPLPVWLQSFNVIQKMQIYDRGLSLGVKTLRDAVVNTFSFIFLSLLNDASVIPLITVGWMTNKLTFYKRISLLDSMDIYTFSVESHRYRAPLLGYLLKQ